jgi:REP element-mobilizing transposase RayT
MVVEANFEADHIHILFKSGTDVNIQRFINSYKSTSSRIIKKEYPKIYDSPLEWSIFGKEVIS